ncbi:MAG: methionine--tRNA ligase [Alphaproteobacteria bacterium]|nr:methionine--tRNA ligase [Alphaproteobacteria bacterium]
MTNKFYITTPIYYPSGSPHIGHCYTTVACDVVSRYKRARGFDVLFLTGTDEHGQKIEDKAAAAGLAPQAYADQIVEEFKKLWTFMNISYDRFVRTTDDYHIKTVQYVFEELYKRGYIYKGQYTGKYCKPCESFWTDSQLVDGKCPDCGREVVETSEEAYFFKLSEFSDRLKALLESGTFLEPESRVKEMVNNFIKTGLEDVCVSRTSFKWGVPVNFDEKHVVYVWVDALSNYISALGYHNDTYSDFDKYWPADIHVMAKEIVRFHSLVWPAMLMALDLPLPKKIYAHGWIVMGDKKMSKSLGNVVDPFILGKRYGIDALRYEILREMPYAGDSFFSTELFLQRINTDLANNLGNLVSRSVSMVAKYFDGTLSAERQAEELDADLINLAKELPSKVEERIDDFHLCEALDLIQSLVSRANKYIDETTPWTLAKSPEMKIRLATVLYNLLETIRICAIMLEPFMPESMKEVLSRIGASGEETSWNSVHEFGVLSRTTTVRAGDPIFPRINIEEEQKFLLADAC